MAQATRDAEEVVRAHAEMWNEQDYARIPELLSETYSEHNPFVPEGVIRGRESFETWMRRITEAFPDFRVDVQDVLVDEETAMAELEFAMTHEGEFEGIPPTGNEVTFRGMGAFVVADGTVEELRNYLDTRQVFEQLGVTDGETR